MARASIHVEPSGATATARHYIRDVVYGANDGVITTFAVVSGVAGGGLSAVAVVVVGAANLAADGVSMGVGNLLAIRAEERAREAASLPELEALLPYVVPGLEMKSVWSTALTFVTLFLLGASRALVTVDRWWRSGAETLLLGGVVAVAAYGAGSLAAALAAG